MEGGVGIGTTTTTTTTTATATTTSTTTARPVRASSRNLYFNFNSTPTFSGPVRRWQKTWVHVSSSKQPTTTTQSSSNAPNPPPPKPPILLCKWTPLSSLNDSPLPRRKLRYTPIVVLEEQERQSIKRVADEDDSGETHHNKKKLAMDTDEIYGMLDINQDLVGAYEDSSN